MRRERFTTVWDAYVNGSPGGPRLPTQLTHPVRLGHRAMWSVPPHHREPLGLWRSAVGLVNHCGEKKENLHMSQCHSSGNALRSVVNDYLTVHHVAMMIGLYSDVVVPSFVGEARVSTHNVNAEAGIERRVLLLHWAAQQRVHADLQ
jgi:hypothetical protein